MHIQFGHSEDAATGYGPGAATGHGPGSAAGYAPGTTAGRRPGATATLDRRATAIGQDRNTATGYSPDAGSNPARRFRAWQDFVDDLFAGLQARSERGGGEFHVRLDLRDLRGARIGRIGGSRHVVVRPADQGRRSDEIGLLLQTRGQSRLEVEGHALTLAAGEATLFDNARPYRFDLAEGFEHRILLFDRDRFGAGRAAVEACRGRLLPTAALTTRLLVQALLTMTDGEDPDWSNPALESLPLALVEWLETACDAATAGTAPDCRSDSRSQRLLRGVLDAARQRLADPELSPAVLAAAHGIAERTLHKLFAAQGLTVMGWVREQRLLSVDRALRAAPAGAKIETIACTHGFDDPAAFRRAYRRRFGRSPGEARARRDPR
ncbi:MAG: helix-turn-helix domain-containing protein [Lautropia sp.]